MSGVRERKAEQDRLQVLVRLEHLVPSGMYGLTVDEIHRDSIRARIPMSRPAIARALRTMIEMDTPLVGRFKANTVGRPWKWHITWAGLAELDDARSTKRTNQ